MFQGWWIVGTHFTVQFFVTGFFAYSLPLLFEPMVQAFDTDRTTVNYLPSLASLLGVFVAPTAGPLVDRWSAKGLMLIGGVAMVLALLGMSVSQNIFQLVIVGALFFGLANVLLGPLTGSAVISRWFTASRGRALGIAAIGTSVGGILLPMAIGLALPAIGWRATLQALAAGMAFMGLPLLLFRFWNHPSDRGLEREPAADGDPALAAAGGDGEERAHETNRDILGRRAFWLLSLSLGLFLAIYSATLANLGQYGGDLGLEVDQIARLVSVLAISGIFGKLVFGYLADRTSLKLLLAAAIGATAFTLVLFSLEPTYSMMLVGSMSMGIATGGILPVWNAIVPAIFGVENFGRAMGLMSPVISVMVTPAFPLAGYVRDSVGSYVPAFQGFVGGLLLAVLLLIPLRVERAPMPTRSG
jgi:MFS family permease